MINHLLWKCFVNIFDANDIRFLAHEMQIALPDTEDRSLLVFELLKFSELQNRSDELYEKACQLRPSLERLNTKQTHITLKQKINNENNFNSLLSNLDELYLQMTAVEKAAKNSLYYYPSGFVSAIRLFGADDEYITENNLNITYSHESFYIYPELSSMCNIAIEKKKEDALKNNRLFFNGPNVRLNKWRANPKDDSMVALEQKVLELELAPIDWYTFAGLNESFRNTYNPDVIASYDYGIGLSFLIRDGDISKSKLSNILDNAISIVTVDGYISYQQRGGRVASVPRQLTSGVAENINRYLDDADPNNSKYLHNTYNTKKSRTFKDASYRPKGVPHPFSAVRRGIKEELSPDLIDYLKPNSIKLIGLSFDLGALHPDILYAVFLDIPKEKIIQVCRLKPGKDWFEGSIHFVEADFNNINTQKVLNQHNWVAAGKASVVRTIELIRSIEHNRKCSFKDAFDFLLRSE